MSVEYVVAIDIVGREGRPSTHDFIEVWLADDRLPFVVEDVVKPASDPRFARRRKFHLKCLLQELELDKVVTKVVNADVEEELSPLLNLSFENFLCSNVRLYPWESQDEVLDFHVAVDVLLELIVLDLSAAILVYVPEHVADVFGNADFIWIG